MALGFLETHERVYSNTAATDLYLDKKKQSYIGGVLEMCNHRSYRHWDNLTEGLRTGLPQSELKGRGAPVFETIYAHPARLKEFLKAMTGVSHGANLAIYDFFRFGTDVVCRQKTLDKYTEKSASESTREDKKTDVDRIHSD